MAEKKMDFFAGAMSHHLNGKFITEETMMSGFKELVGGGQDYSSAEAVKAHAKAKGYVKQYRVYKITIELVETVDP